MSSELTHGSLFSGIGGFELGASQAGIETIWSCEIEPFQRKILKQHFPKTKQYEDIKEMRENIPYVDIISGGFPCQDISFAGKGEGIKGARSGLWSEMGRVVDVVRPKYVVVENSSMLLSRGLHTVLSDFAQIGYDAEWQCLHATTFGLQHLRERIYLVAYPCQGNSQGGGKKAVFRKPLLSREFTRVSPGWRKRRDLPVPRNYRSTNELPNLAHRLAALGNAVCPRIAHWLFECIKAHHAQ